MNKLYIKKAFINLLVFGIIMLPILVWAFTFENPFGSNRSLYTLVKNVADFIVQFAAAFVVLALIYSGYLFVSAQGEEGKITKAKGAFFWGVIGGLVILGSWALAEMVCETARSLGASVTSCN